MRQADWIIFTGQTRSDPDMAHRPGVKDVTPTKWQRIERRCRQAGRDLRAGWQQAVYNLASVLLPTPRFAGA